MSSSSAEVQQQRQQQEEEEGAGDSSVQQQQGEEQQQQQQQQSLFQPRQGLLVPGAPPLKSLADDLMDLLQSGEGTDVVLQVGRS
jgi:hypothetical protein